ncbi:uncharacterized protein LOC143256982 isoform X1 [Tachypleus tridentatus]|uniref:uncharacterized protein LOC143256982 isoform X1 n=1 Tax=Tachypleus tridentatus TaxID=6853 RepID=UPI003FD09011
MPMTTLKYIPVTTSEAEPLFKRTTLEASSFKKGLLWQQRDKFFSRWKKRYFILTRDYLACFKKGAKIGISEMGSFLYKISLVDIEGLQWANKKREGVIAIRIRQEGQLLLWSTTRLDDWMFALQEAVCLSKGRREVLRKSQSLIPHITDRKLTRSQLMILKHNVYDNISSPSARYRNRRSGQQENVNMRPTSTPYLGKRMQRISGSTPCRAVSSPRLAPQCASRSLISLVSHVKSPASQCYLEKPSPRSLQVSPALSQRSLYAQHILSTSEISTTDMKMKKVGCATATSEFSYIRSDAPLSSLSSKQSLCRRSITSETNNYENSLSCPSTILAQLEKLHVLSPPGKNSRPSNIYGR